LHRLALMGYSLATTLNVLKFANNSRTPNKESDRDEASTDYEFAT